MTKAPIMTILAVTIYIAGCAHNSAPRIDTGKALEHFHLEGHEHSKTYGSEVPAQTVDLTTYKPMPLLADIKMKSRAMLWLGSDGKTVAVDDQAFTALKVVQVRGLSKGQRVGRFIGDDSMPRRDLVKFLIKSDIVSSNLHVSAEVYLMQETSDSSGYSCRVFVVHPYWTSQKNINHYHYMVRISKNGEIRLAPVKS